MGRQRVPVRTCAVVCPDWPLVAAGLAGTPAAVVHAGRVIACSMPAREEGVRVGNRRREAEGLCGDLNVGRNDPSRDARMFEQVVGAVASFTPRVEVTRPGLCSFPTRGPARYFGGEGALAGKVAAAVNGVLDALPGSVPTSACRIGIADGPFAALLAAEEGLIVEQGASRAFLAPYPLTMLGMPELVDLLRRLGIRTFGELGEMPERAVTGRFGAEGAEAWHRARGLDDRSLLLEDPPPDLTVTCEVDPPADRVDAVAFVAVGLAEELCRRLRELELACTRILVAVETEHGETLERLWRSDRPFTARTMVDRVRWQLEGWLAGSGGGESVVDEPTAGVAVLHLAADEVVHDRGRQLGFWGEASEADRRAERGLARVQGLLGHAGVTTAVRIGGRSPAEQVRLVPWGNPRQEPAAAKPAGGSPPWPGRLPSPAPAVVPLRPLPAVVLDDAGAAVRVSGRGELSAPPGRVVLGAARCAAPGPAGAASAARCAAPGPGPAGAEPGTAISGWAGPWPVDERWWDSATHRRRARLQVVLEGGAAYLLALEGGRWWAEAVYD